MKRRQTTAEAWRDLEDAFADVGREFLKLGISAANAAKALKALKFPEEIVERIRDEAAARRSWRRRFRRWRAKRWHR